MDTGESEVETSKDWPEEKIKEYLKKEGCVFHSKRKLKIPELKEEDYDKLFIDDEFEMFTAVRAVAILKSFLSRVSITDHFHEDHVSRRKWKQKLPIPIYEYYRDKNQLRAGSLYSIFGAMLLLGTASKIPRVQDVTEEKYEAFFDAYNGKTRQGIYDDLPDEEKIKFVEWVEDEIIEVLEFLKKIEAKSA